MLGKKIDSFVKFLIICCILVHSSVCFLLVYILYHGTIANRTNLPGATHWFRSVIVVYIGYEVWFREWTAIQFPKKVFHTRSSIGNVNQADDDRRRPRMVLLFSHSVRQSLLINLFWIQWKIWIWNRKFTFILFADKTIHKRSTNEWLFFLFVRSHQLHCVCGCMYKLDIHVSTHN